MNGPRQDPATAAPAIPDDAAVTLQAAALLLDYPGHGSAGDLELIAEALAETPQAPGRAPLVRFVAGWSALTQSEREKRYVAAFDLGEPVSLYLTERGGAAVSCIPEARGAGLLALRRTYAACGVDVRRDELPDYLPLLLEVAAHAPRARSLLREHRSAIERIAGELTERDEPFAGVLAAVLEASP